MNSHVLPEDAICSIVGTSLNFLIHCKWTILVDWCRGIVNGSRDLNQGQTPYWILHGWKWGCERSLQWYVWYKGTRLSFSKHATQVFFYWTHCTSVPHKCFHSCQKCNMVLPWLRVCLHDSFQLAVHSHDNGILGAWKHNLLKTGFKAQGFENDAFTISM